MSINKLDSQHFWDQIDVLPTEAIALIEEDIVNILIEKQKVTLDTLLYDTTIFLPILIQPIKDAALSKEVETNRSGWI